MAREVDDKILGVFPSEQVSAAESYFSQALDVARGQQAKSLELRALIALNRLYQQQGRSDGSMPLAEAYGWFTEGFASPDLQQAKAIWQIEQSLA
jgi:hypothetical protein